MDLEHIERVIWPDMHPWLDRNKYLGVARSLPKPFCDVMREESPIEIHSPSLFLFRDVPFFGCAIGANSIRISQLENKGTLSATLQFSDYPGFERAVRLSLSVFF